MKCRVRLPLAGFELDVDLATEARAVGVFGPSGSGKTSLLECVAGWRTPTEGFIEWNGRVLFDSAGGVDLARDERLEFTILVPAKRPPTRNQLQCFHQRLLLQPSMGDADTTSPHYHFRG